MHNHRRSQSMRVALGGVFGALALTLMLDVYKRQPSTGRNMMPKSVVSGTCMYFWRMSLANPRTRCSSALAAASTPAASAVS